MGRVLNIEVLVFAIFVVVQIVACCGPVRRKGYFRFFEKTGRKLTIENFIVDREITPCEDGWTAYKDEKCIKVFSEKFLQYPRAKAYCESVDSIESPASLLSIKNDKEQKSFQNFIFGTSKSKRNIWLGLRYTKNGFLWPDGSSSIDFTNWMDGKIENDAEWMNSTLKSEDNYKCVEMNQQGEWLLASCLTNNTFVCERQQIWSLRKIQKSFLQFKNQQLNNPVPIGFIYVQLSEQPDPATLWPTVQWRDITSHYAGLFFRAEGSGSKKFNHGEQEENLPRIISVEPMSVKARTRTVPVHHTALLTKEYQQQFPWSVKVSYSEEEVRPRNKAVRVWTRIP